MLDAEPEMAKKNSIFLNLLNLAPRKLEALITVLSDPDAIFRASAADLRKIYPLTAAEIGKILDLRQSAVLSRELELLAREEIECLDIFDGDYPSLLKEIDFPPPVLYLKGDRKVLDKVLFAVVGSRQPSRYGKTVAGDFAQRLAERGLVIVSGLAKGIDSIAHRQAIRSGESVAVLGSGLLRIYPRRNRLLAERISQHGAVISEFPLLSGPRKENFPRRNRIISGLARGVLVVEAAKRSGALITAHRAVEQNREVFAVPGNINAFCSTGTNRLIQEGAKLTVSLEDILEELNI